MGIHREPDKNSSADDGTPDKEIPCGLLLHGRPPFRLSFASSLIIESRKKKNFDLSQVR
jgi:hypothetical protein